MPSEIFRHMLISVSETGELTEEQEKQLGVGQFRAVQPFIPQYQLPLTPGEFESKFGVRKLAPGYRAVQPGVTVQDLVRQMLSVTAFQGSNTLTKVSVQQVLNNRYVLIDEFSQGSMCGYKSGDSLIEVPCQGGTAFLPKNPQNVKLTSGLVLHGILLQGWGPLQNNALEQLLNRVAPLSNGNPYAQVKIEGYQAGQLKWGIATCAFKKVGAPGTLLLAVNCQIA